MGLSGARNAAVTGLQAQSASISISADNIANASTTGYKAIKSQFSTLVTDTGAASGYSSGGVSVQAKSLIDEQGLLESTGRVTDLAISGNGFFAVQDPEGTLQLTRAGEFDINNKGELINPDGLQLLGWPLDNDGRKPGDSGNLNTTASESTSSLSIIDTNAASGTASATTSVAIGANLNSGQSTFQGSTLTLDPRSSSINDGIAQEDIVVPTSGVQRGDELTLESNSIEQTFVYGGFAQSLDIDDVNIFGSATTNASFTTGPNLSTGDQFTITTPSSGTVSYTFIASNPSTVAGEFNSLESLSAALDSTVGLTARIAEGAIYVSSIDAREGITFGDINGSNLHTELGFTDQLQAETGELRWNTFEGLASLANSLNDFGAVVNNPSVNASIDLFARDPQQTLTVTKSDNQVVADLQSTENGSIASTALIVPVAGSSIAAGDTVVFEDDQAGGGNTLTATYGGFETSDTISSANPIFDAEDATTVFSGASITDTHSFTIDDGSGTTTFTFTAANPNTAAGQFNSLTTLAAALNSSTDYIARIENDTVYVAANDADLALTFANVDATDFLTELGLNDVLASGGTGRFATMAELQGIIDGDANFSATLSNPAGNSSIEITSATPATGLVVGNSSDDLIAELGITDNTNVGDAFFVEFSATGTITADQQQAEIGVTYDPSDPSLNIAGGNIEAHFPRNIEVFDALGTGHDFQLSFLKVGTNEWAVEFYALDPSEIVGGTDGLVASGIIEFNGDGSLNSVSDSLSNAITIPWTTGATENVISFDFGTAGQPFGTVGASTVGETDGLRQFDSAYNVDFLEQNGVAAGQFRGITVSDDGTVNANFTNGEIKPIFKLPVITIANPNGLSPQTGNTFSVTQESGEVNLRDAGAGGAGSIVAGSLEGSTADIAEELTKTIGIQSNYNANASLISTVRDMEEELNRRL